MIFTGRRGIVLLVLFNIISMVGWLALLRWGAWLMRSHPRESPPSYLLFLGSAIFLSLIYSFMVLLANKFLAQNRADRTGLRIARMSFAVSMGLYPLAMLWYLYR